MIKNHLFYNVLGYNSLEYESQYEQKGTDRSLCYTYNTNHQITPLRKVIYVKLSSLQLWKLG